MKHFLQLFFLVGLTTCASEQVQYATPRADVDFRAYQTFNFMDVTARNEDALVIPGTGVETLKQAVGREMTRRGYQQSDTPNLLVNIGVVTQSKVQTRETTLLQDAPRYIGQRNYHWHSQEVPVGRYEEGTATVEVVDAARNELIWEGSVKSVLTRDANKLTKRIKESVEALFNKYPVEPRQ